MSVLDLIALAILAYNTLRGLASGLIRTAFGLSAVTCATAVSWQHPEWGRAIVDRFLAPGTLSHGFGQPLTVWLLTFIGVNLTGILLRFSIQKTVLAQVDRIGGAVFGFASGAILLFAPILAISQLTVLRENQVIARSLSESLTVTALSPFISALQQRPNQKR